MFFVRHVCVHCQQLEMVNTINSLNATSDTSRNPHCLNKGIFACELLNNIPSYLAHMDMKLAVVILAAGQGSRMHSAIPKVLHEIAGRPLLHHVIDAARELQPEQIML